MLVPPPKEDTPVVALSDDTELLLTVVVVLEVTCRGEGLLLGIGKETIPCTGGTTVEDDDEGKLLPPAKELPDVES